MLSHLLIVSPISLVLLVAIVMLICVAFLFSLGESVDEVVCGLVRNIAQKPLNKGFVTLKLILDGVARNRNNLYVTKRRFYWGR